MFHLNLAMYNTPTVRETDHGLSLLQMSIKYGLQIGSACMENVY